MPPKVKILYNWFMVPDRVLLGGQDLYEYMSNVRDKVGGRIKLEDYLVELWSK